MLVQRSYADIALRKQCLSWNTWKTLLLIPATVFLVYPTHIFHSVSYRSQTNKNQQALHCHFIREWMPNQKHKNQTGADFKWIIWPQFHSEEFGWELSQTNAEVFVIFELQVAKWTMTKKKVHGQSNFLKSSSYFCTCPRLLQHPQEEKPSPPPLYF